MYWCQTNAAKKNHTVKPHYVTVISADSCKTPSWPYGLSNHNVRVTHECIVVWWNYQIPNETFLPSLRQLWVRFKDGYTTLTAVHLSQPHDCETVQINIPMTCEHVWHIHVCCVCSRVLGCVLVPSKEMQRSTTQELTDLEEERINVRTYWRL